jgi:hypothetical protein
MIVSEYLGEPLQHQKITPGNTATGFNVNCYKYLMWILNIDAGTDELTVGSWIVGASSGAVAKVLSMTISTGDWGSDNVTGYAICDSWNGTAWTDNEKVKMAADATCADVNGPMKSLEEGYPFKGCMAKAALVSAYANTELVCFDGSTPDQTALVGQPMAAASSIILADINQIRNFKAIDYTASSAGIIQATFFF